MSEQKYYVKLIQTGLVHADERHQLYLWELDGKYSYQSKVYDEEYLPDRLWHFQFTKKELEKVMDGAIYHVLIEEWECGGGYYDPQEVLNPAFELVPVEAAE